MNLNTLLDRDEDFLFENAEFRRLIKTVCREHDYLVNANFDVSVECALPELRSDPQAWHHHSYRFFNLTFNNLEGKRHDCFTRMMRKYREGLKPYQDEVNAIFEFRSRSLDTAE